MGTGSNYTWADGAYGKKSESKSVLLSTGASEDFSIMGIYDLAGNVEEWTLESDTSAGADEWCCMLRGMTFFDISTDSNRPASYHLGNYVDGGSIGDGFRVSIF